MESSGVRQDNNFFNLPGDNFDLSSPEVPSLIDIDATAFSSAAKISHKNNITGQNLKVAQCNENAVDIDVSTNINISGDFGLPDKDGKIGRADQVITIKGGCSNISVSGVIHSQPTRGKAHVSIGNWMDQDYRMNSNIYINLKQADGSPINYSTGWVKPFSVKANGAKWMVVESLELKVYWVIKYLVRLVMRIPQGTKGPSWL